MNNKEITRMLALKSIYSKCYGEDIESISEAEIFGSIPRATDNQIEDALGFLHDLRLLEVGDRFDDITMQDGPAEIGFTPLGRIVSELPPEKTLEVFRMYDW